MPSSKSSFVRFAYCRSGRKVINGNLRAESARPAQKSVLEVSPAFFDEPRKNSTFSQRANRKRDLLLRVLLQIRHVFSSQAHTTTMTGREIQLPVVMLRHSLGLDREDIAGSLGTACHKRVNRPSADTASPATARLRNLHTDTGTIKKTMRIRSRDWSRPIPPSRSRRHTRGAPALPLDSGCPTPSGTSRRVSRPCPEMESDLPRLATFRRRGNPAPAPPAPCRRRSSREASSAGIP